MREGFNISSPASLPSYVRGALTRRVAAWILPIQALPIVSEGCADTTSMDCIPTSAHVRRDVSFSETLENFLAAEQRSEETR